MHREGKGEYKYTGDGDYIIGGMCPDFSNINGQKKVIELYGDYWHSEEVRELSLKEEEQRKITKYTEHGFACLVIWERELKSKTTAELVNIIKAFNNKEHIKNDQEQNVSIQNETMQLRLF